MPRDSARVTPPRSADARLRAALVMPLAALAVHQGRYYLAFGAHTPARLVRDGHAYLGSVVPFAVLGAALALGLLAGRLARAWQGGDAARPAAPRSHPTVRIWGLCAFILLGLYCAQELTEGAFASGHAGGLAAVLGSGGWYALPLAILIGGLLTLLLRASDALAGLITRLCARPKPAAPGHARQPLVVDRADWRLTGASGVSAGRAPPLAVGHR